MLDGDWPLAPPPPPEESPARRKHGSGTAILAGLLVVLVTITVTLGPVDTVRAVRDLLRSEDGDGYAFLLTQPGSHEPVTYDPCQVIRVAVNPRDAPDAYADLVATAISHVSGPSGLRFEVVGETDDRPGQERSLSDPVLVSWADDDEVPELEGLVAGVGGSSAVTRGGRTYYVTGSVTLDRGVFDDLMDEPGGRLDAQAIVDHEFGHLVGLDHVKDRGELMRATNSGQLEWGPGDLAGLALLGQGRCAN